MEEWEIAINDYYVSLYRIYFQIYFTGKCFYLVNQSLRYYRVDDNLSAGNIKWVFIKRGIIKMGWPIEAWFLWEDKSEFKRNSRFSKYGNIYSL